MLETNVFPTAEPRNPVGRRQPSSRDDLEGSREQNECTRPKTVPFHRTTRRAAKPFSAENRRRECTRRGSANFIYRNFTPAASIETLEGLNKKESDFPTES